MSKKGVSINMLPAMVILLVVTAIVLSIGADIVTNVQTGFTSNTYAYNASTEGLKGIDEVAQWQDTIGLVIGAAVIIGLVLGAFRFGGGM